MHRIEEPVGNARGVGPKFAQGLASAGILTLEDLLLVLPLRYIDLTSVTRIADLEPGTENTIAGEVVRRSLSRVWRRKLSILRARIRDGSGVLDAVWFNQPYLFEQLSPGSRLLFHGPVRIDKKKAGLEMGNPRIAPVYGDDGGGPPDPVVAVYRSIRGIGSGRIRRILRDLVSDPAFDGGEFLPGSVLSAFGLPERTESFRRLHAPRPPQDGGAFAPDDEARRRFEMEELLIIEIALCVRRDMGARARALPAYHVRADGPGRDLPFDLTKAQRRVMADIHADLASGIPMNRFVQGDVGSGKTVLAFLAMAAVAEGGGQAALMVPTEILADQHYESFSRLFPHLAGQVRLLKGSLAAADKKSTREDLASGRASLAIGTHALGSAGVAFRALHLAVIDEQQRFGVRQRSRLLAKGDRPHFVLMTATPIPRSLAMILYGDLDISFVDEIPSGRGRIETHVRRTRDRDRVLDYIAREARQGRQAFLVHPLIGGDDDDDPAAARALTASVRQISRKYPDLRIGVLHGRMDADEAGGVMRRFMEGESDVLLSTSVVEVGIDNPRATIMCIQNAERFGLSQLHQMRGRVGRGSADSKCILIADDDCPESTLEKLRKLEEISDGFQVAELDLDTRGPGEILGSRQWGFAGPSPAALKGDPGVAVLVKEQAARLVADGLGRHPALQRKLEFVFGADPASAMMG